MWKIGGEFGNTTKITLKFENWIADNNSSATFPVFRFNTSTVSSFQLALVDPLIKLKNWLVWCETWNSVRKCLEIHQGFSCIHLNQVNFVNTIHLSFIRYSIDQNKTAACLYGNSIQYYFHAPKFHTRIVLGMQKLNLQKTTVWTLIVLKCWKILCKCFVSTHQQFEVLNWHLWIR